MKTPTEEVVILIGKLNEVFEDFSLCQKNDMVNVSAETVEEIDLLAAQMITSLWLLSRRLEEKPSQQGSSDLNKLL